MKHKLIRSHYEHRVRPGRENYDILDWGSRESQLARFAVFRRVYQPAKASDRTAGRERLLDIGCGLTDFQSFLENHGCHFTYVGVDIVPEIIAEGRRRHPGRDVILADIFHREPFRPKTFDVAFCSGTLNLEVGNNERFVEHALSAMCPLVRRCLVINFLHCRAQHKYDHCHYYDPEAVIACVPEYMSQACLVDDYLDNDFTLALWR